MAQQPPNRTNPESDQPPRRRAESPSTVDWWESLTAAQKREYIEQYGNPPAGAIRSWRGPQDPGFGNG